MFGSHKSDWLQHETNVLVGLFRRYGLADNVAKSCKMIFHPGDLRAEIPEEVMELKCTGVGDSYQVRLQRRIPCLECEVEIAAGYMTEHRFRMNGTEPVIEWSRLPVSQTVHSPQVYGVIFPRTKKQ